jgi:outer membrane protein insertion porin family
LAYGEDKWLEFQAAKVSHNLLHSLSTEKLHSLLMRYAHGNHQLSYECSWREVLPGSAASPRIFQEAGHSLKSAFRYSLIHDTRDDPIMPSKGHAFQSTTEVAGLGGDVKFVKQELAAQFNFSLGRGCSVNTLAKAGFLHPLGDRSRLVDRFFLGGPVSLRGFQYCGVGPREKDCALGGDLFGLIAIHLTFPFPLRDVPDFVQGHIFANAGNLTTYDQNASIATNFKTLTSRDSMRTAIGAGLLFKTVFGRIELNLCHPIHKQPGDIAQTWQIGLSLSFL